MLHANGVSARPYLLCSILQRQLGEHVCSQCRVNAHAGFRGFAGITKEYLAKLDRPLTDRAVEAMAEGCQVKGKHVRPVHVGSASSDPAQCKLRVVVQDGRNREVRHLIEHAGASPMFQLCES